MLYSVTDLDLRTTANLGDVTDAQGDDIIFRALDDATCGGAGTSPCTLDHEIESYTALSGQLVAWVRIPSLNTASAGSNTVIYIYYGNSDITTSIQNADGVWDATYGGVWHLKEELAGTGTVDLYKDSSGNANDGDDFISATWQSGKINGGHSFDGVDDYVVASDSASLNFGTGDFTVAAWVRSSQAQVFDEWPKILEKFTNSPSTQGYRLMLYESTGSPNPSFSVLSGGVGATAAATVNIRDGLWHRLVGVKTSTELRIYVDGSQSGTPDSHSLGTTSNSLTLRFGRSVVSNGDYFQGDMDEVHLSNIARSVCWIGAERNNQNWPNKTDFPTDGFVTVGSEESSPLTAVELMSFTATRYDRGVLAQWRTGYEIDNLGFHVYREIDGHKMRVNPSLIAGSGLMAGQGTAVAAEQRYAFWDLEAGSGDRSAVYWLEDLDFNRTSTWHGPVTLVDGSLQAPPTITSSAALHQLGKGQGQTRRKVFLERGGRLERRGKVGARTVAVSATERQWALAGQAAVKIGVERPAWYRIAQPELVAAGLNPNVDPRTLRLFVDGVEQAIAVTGERVGRPLSSAFAIRRTVHALTRAIRDDSSPLGAALKNQYDNREGRGGDVSCLDRAVARRGLPRSLSRRQREHAAGAGRRIGPGTLGLPQDCTVCADAFTCGSSLSLGECAHSCAASQSSPRQTRMAR